MEDHNGKKMMYNKRVMMPLGMSFLTDERAKQGKIDKVRGSG